MHHPNKHTNSNWNHVPICNSFADMEVLKFQMPLISIISNCTTAVMCPIDAQPQQTYPFLHVPIRCAALTNVPIYLWWLPVSSILPLWFGGKSGKMLKYGPNLPRKRAHYTKFSVSYKYAFHIWKKADLIGEKKISHFEHLCHYVTPSWTLALIETWTRQVLHDLEKNTQNSQFWSKITQ